MTNILDEKTRSLLFNNKSTIFGKWGATAMFGGLDTILNDFSQTPLNDLSAINERLDVIGEFVSDSDLTKQFDSIIQTFRIDYDEYFRKDLSAFYRAKEFGVLKNDKVGDLRNAIQGIAEKIQELPLTLDYQFKTATLQRFAKDYEVIMGKKDVNVFFGYIVSLDEQITQAEKELGITERNEKCSSSKDREHIPFETLDSMMDRDRFTMLLSEIGIVNLYAEELFPYVELGKLAVKNNYVRPEIVSKEENCLVIQNGRRDENRRGFAIPNSTELSDGVKVEILEGVNSAGKTFDIKKALYIATTGLSGCWVPADYAKISIRDKIILREKGIGDSISAFQQDCKSANECNPPKEEYWLMALDETFTSTERRGGEALTYGLIGEVIAQQKSLLIISSHYPELSKSIPTLENHVRVNHFPFEKDESSGELKINFPYKKQEGPLNDYRYAIAVSRAKGFDETILKYAEQRLEASSKK